MSWPSPASPLQSSGSHSTLPLLTAGNSCPIRQSELALAIAVPRESLTSLRSRRPAAGGLRRQAPVLRRSLLPCVGALAAVLGVGPSPHAVSAHAAALSIISPPAQPYYRIPPSHFSRLFPHRRPSLSPAQLPSQSHDAFCPVPGTNPGSPASVNSPLCPAFQKRVWPESVALNLRVLPLRELPADCCLPPPSHSLSKEEAMPKPSH